MPRARLITPIFTLFFCIHIHFTSSGNCFLLTEQTTRSECLDSDYEGVWLLFQGHNLSNHYYPCAWLNLDGHFLRTCLTGSRPRDPDFSVASVQNYVVNSLQCIWIHLANHLHGWCDLYTLCVLAYISQWLKHMYVSHYICMWLKCIEGFNETELLPKFGLKGSPTGGGLEISTCARDFWRNLSSQQWLFWWRNEDTVATGSSLSPCVSSGPSLHMHPSGIHLLSLHIYPLPPILLAAHLLDIAVGRAWLHHGISGSHVATVELATCRRPHEGTSSWCP